MSDNPRISVGDRVEVGWEYVPSLRGIVEMIPFNHGDVFIIIEDDGTINYVQNFCRMKKMK